MDPDDSRWVDAEAGPVARPYMLTGGRTRPRGPARFDLIDYIVRTGKPADGYPLTPERSYLLRLCRQPITVADLASATRIPLGLVRVPLADLASDGLVTVRPQARAGPLTDTGLLQKVLNGLNALKPCGPPAGVRPARARRRRRKSGSPGRLWWCT